MKNRAAVIQLMGAEGVGPKRLSRLLRRVKAESISVLELVQMTDRELIGEYKFVPKGVDTMRSLRGVAMIMAQELDDNNVQMLMIGEPDYPSVLVDRLGEEGAPPVMFAHGNLEVLEKDSVGFCGPRNVTETGATAVVELASAVSRKGLAVVSGFAGGVDLAAHISCLQSGGSTVAVLPTGILHFKPTAAFRELADDSNFVALSEFFPKAGWAVGYAMQRNRTICGLSGAVVIIEPAETGGTNHAGKAALEAGRPLFLARTDEDAKLTVGERFFVRRGAVPLVRDGDTWSTGALFEAAGEVGAARGGQESLFGPE